MCVVCRMLQVKSYLRQLFFLKKGKTELSSGVVISRCLHMYMTSYCTCIVLTHSVASSCGPASLPPSPSPPHSSHPVHFSLLPPHPLSGWAQQSLGQCCEGGRVRGGGDGVMCTGEGEYIGDV